MKQLLWLLAVLGLTASVASAGPNAGGVLWVHDTNITFSSDIPLPPVSTPPTDSSNVDNNQTLSDGVVNRFWKVYAAFPAGSSPRLKTCGWAIQFPDANTSAESYVSVTGGDAPNADGAGTDFWIGDLGFPTESGGQIGQSFPTGPRRTLVVELFWFYGFGYHVAGDFPAFSTAQHSAPLNRVFGDDATPTNEDPIMGYGSMGFGAPGFTPRPTSDPLAACCSFPPNVLPGDSTVVCRMRRHSACIDTVNVRVWHQEWFSCDPMPCPPPTGACCYTDGRCSVTNPQSCSNGGGVFQGNFEPCTPNPCPVPSACCYPAGNCLVRTREACESGSTPGIWHAEWVSCDVDSCPPPPTGACCTSAGVCVVRSESACASFLNTIWHDDWETCDPNPCPQPVWACCNLLDGTCVDTTLAACVAPVRVWHENVLCDSLECPAPAPIGACCYPDGSCAILANVLCPATGPGAGNWHAEWVACDPNPCPQPEGVCCDPLRGECVVRSEADCAPPGVWQIFPNSCAPNPCPQPPHGVCCSFPQLCSITFEADCQNAANRDIWHSEWTACLPVNPCPEPSPTGGCCTPNGGCTITVPAACTAEGLVWHIGWITCDPNGCPQPPTGACCDRNGNCTVTAEFLCLESENPDPRNPRLNTWRGSNTVCEPNSCPPSVPPGVCCLPSGTCIIAVEARCADGAWTAGGTCTTNPCPPPGACCSPDATCLIESALQCVGPDEVYQGNGTVCTPNPCQRPTGPCCFTSGVCEARTRELCAQVGGVFQDSVAVCSPNPCPQPSGACCTLAGVCTVTEGRTNCDGAWTAFGTCSPNPCTLSRGSCCNLSGICTITYARDCANAASMWTASQTPCSPNPCAPPGVCCAPAGGCTVTLETACPDSVGAWTVSGACVPNPCPQLPSGACCTFLDFGCEVTLEAACPDSVGTWTLSGTCVPNLCPPPPTGSCCALSGACAVTSQVDCREAWAWTEGAVCSPNPCPQPTGACCDLNTGACTITPSPIECDGLWAMYAVCSPVNPCGQARGSCCDISGSCTITYSSGCVDGSWRGGGEPCGPRACPVAQCACCTSTGDCLVTTQAICEAPDVWLNGRYTCEPNPCPQPAQGVCCAEDESCTVTTQANCPASSIWRGELPACEATSCPPATPTQRTSWGRVKNMYR